MANSIDFILTTAASELISKGLSGKTLNFTRMAVGDGFSYDTAAAKGYTALVNEVLSIDITKKETLSASSVKVTSAFKNTDAQKEFYYREVGLFALDPDTGEEILYAYGNRNDAAELITHTGSNVITKQLSFIISVGNSANVTFNVNAGVYALQEDLTTLQTSLQELNSTKASQADLVVERARITNLATLSDGSTTGDAELTDARIDDKGVVHPNAGSAFRNRVGKLNNDLVNISGRNLMGRDTSKVMLYEVNLPAGTTLTVSTCDGSIFSESNTLQLLLFNKEKVQVDYFIINNGENYRTFTVSASKGDIAYLGWNEPYNVALMVTADSYVTPYEEYRKVVNTEFIKNYFGRKKTIDNNFLQMKNNDRNQYHGRIEDTPTSNRLTTSGEYFLKKGELVEAKGRYIYVYEWDKECNSFIGSACWYYDRFIINHDGYYAFTIKNVDESDIVYEDGILTIESDFYRLADKYDALNESLFAYGIIENVSGKLNYHGYNNGASNKRATVNTSISIYKNTIIRTDGNYSFYIYSLNDDNTWKETLCDYSNSYFFNNDCRVVMVFKKNDGGAINIKELLSSIQIDKTYPNSVCIMNYNVQWFSGRNANTVLQNAILDKYNPDIIGLQEFRENIAGIPVWKTLFRNYGYTHTTRDGNVNYKGLASKIPFGTVEDKAFVNQYTEQRGYSKTYLNINGKNVCWINAHTDLDESTKVAQCKEVFGLVANEEYFIITGDFNTDYCFSTDDEEYKTIMKQFIDAGYHSANCSEQHGFLGTYCGAPTISGYNSGKMRPDDHIITSSNITIDKVFADDTKTMEMFVDENNIDHFPLVAFITIN